MATRIEELGRLPKATRDAAYGELFSEAVAAGIAAAKAKTPTPMHVVQRADPLDDSSPVVKDYGTYADGACGFAWVTLTPATSSFARWVARNKGARKGYLGGLQINAPSLGEYGQSYELKFAYAVGFAETLQAAGLKAYPEGRLD